MMFSVFIRLLFLSIIVVSNSFAATYSILSLGSRKDAKTFAKGVKNQLGLTTGRVIFPNHFFSRLDTLPKKAQVRDAWLKSVDKNFWGNDEDGDAYRRRFSVIDETANSVC